MLVVGREADEAGTHKKTKPEYFASGGTINLMSYAADGRAKNEQ